MLRIHAVVLDRVRRAHDLHMLQSHNGAQKRQLHLLRQGGGHALQVVFIRVQPHWFYEQLMPLLVRKADDFVLDGGAVPGADALDSAGIHG